MLNARQYRYLEFFSRCLLWALLGLPTVCLGVQVEGLYEAEVPVAGQDAEQRNLAISEAFAAVLVRVTGSRTIAQRPELAGDIEKASRYVQQYRFRLAPDDGVDRPLDDQQSGDEQPEEPQRLLKVAFDPAAVRRLLRERRLPIWGENRPSGLVWLGLEERGRRSLVVPDRHPELRKSFQRAAAARGLAVDFPLMDLEDQTALQVADLWGDFTQNVQAASRRYAADLILTGRLIRVARNLWRAEWRIYQGGQVNGWSAQGTSSEELAFEGIQHLADLLAERFAPVGGEASLSLIRLRVDGVNDLNRYARLGRFLKSQSVVEAAAVNFVEPDAVTYELRVRGGMQLLEQGLELGGLIEPVSELGTVEPYDDGVDLHYRMK